MVDERGAQEAVGVRRVRGHGDLDPGDVHEPRLEALRVLRPHAHPGDDRRADHERHGELAAREVVQLRGLVEDLVHRDADEVEELDLAHCADAGDREADGVADRARLAERRVADPLLAVVLVEPARDAERAPVGADVLADQHHRLGAVERLAGAPVLIASLIVSVVVVARLGGRRHAPPSIDSRNVPQGLRIQVCIAGTDARTTTSRARRHGGLMPARVGVDSYAYHRLLGEVRRGELPPPHVFPRGSLDVVAEARRLGLDFVLLQTSFLGDPTGFSAGRVRRRGGRRRDRPVVGRARGPRVRRAHRRAPGPPGLAQPGGAARTPGHAHRGGRAGTSRPARRSESPAYSARRAPPPATTGSVLALENHGDLTADELERLARAGRRPAHLLRHGQRASRRRRRGGGGPTSRAADRDPPPQGLRRPRGTIPHRARCRCRSARA